MATERRPPGDATERWFWFGAPVSALRALAERVVADEVGDETGNGIDALSDAQRLDVAVAIALRSRDEEWRRRLVDAAVVAWPDETEAKAADLLRSRGWRRRIVAAGLLGTLCEYRMERIPALVETLVAAFDRERDARVLVRLVAALSAAADMEGAEPPRRERGRDEAFDWQLDMPSGLKLRQRPLAWEALRGGRLERVAALARHPDSAIRHRLAVALEGFDLGEPAVLAALVELTRDPDDAVRDWATFTLAMAYDEADDDEVRSALWDRRTDGNPETRDEALYGLVMREAPGALDALDAALRSKEVSDYLLEAAMDSKRPALVPALRQLATWWPAPHDIEEIIAECEAGQAAPERRAEARRPHPTA